MYKIDKDIISKSKDYCSKRGRCLQGDFKGSCKPIKFNGTYLIVEPINKTDEALCLNCVKVNDYYVCLCAIRKEIFRKYNQ